MEFGKFGFSIFPKEKFAGQKVIAKAWRVKNLPKENIDFVRARKDFKKSTGREY